MGLLGSLDVSASGMAAQRARAEVLVENIANADTTRTPDGGPYRRKQVVFESRDVSNSFSSVFSELTVGTEGVGVSEVRVDTAPPERKYLPGHPDADKDGYVSIPRSNPAEDMVDLLGAARGYEANIAAISATKDMIQRTIDLFR